LKFRRLACVALLAGLCAASVQVVDAFYDDTHYSLTYFIARSCGYTPMQAWRVASADVGVDYSGLSEPEQVERVKAIEETAHDSRIRFHAMWDYRLPVTTSRSLAPAGLRGQEIVLGRLGDTQRNPGVLLHFLQDEAPHAGYSSWGGHWVPSNRDALDPFWTLPFGSMTDNLGYSQKQTASMVDKTIAALSAFMVTLQTHQRPRATCNAAAIMPVLVGLIEANPISLAAKSYRLRIDRLMADTRKASPALGVTEWQLTLVDNLVELGALAGATKLTAPKADKADAVIAGALNLQFELPQYRYKPASERIPYTYDASGHTPSAVFALDGALNATVQGAVAGDVSVSLWAAPTRVGEQPYLLQCKTASGVTRFTNVPVGDLIVQTVADGKVTRTPVRFERPEQPFQISVAPSKKDENKDQCSQPAVAAAAKALCANAIFADAAPMTPAQGTQAASLEKDLDTKLDSCKKEEQARKDTDSQARQTTPGKGGSGVGTAVKVAVGVGGAVGAGLVLKNALDELKTLDTATTSTSTTTTTSTGATSGGIRFVSGSFNCTYNAGGVVNSCSGSSVTVNITVPMSVGSSLKLFTNHIQSLGSVQTTANPPGNVTFNGFSPGGWFDQCGPPVTQLGVANLSVSTSLVASVSGLSLPVTCR
jgi:hypothetical protein